MSSIFHGEPDSLSSSPSSLPSSQSTVDDPSAGNFFLSSHLSSRKEFYRSKCEDVISWLCKMEVCKGRPELLEEEFEQSKLKKIMSEHEGSLVRAGGMAQRRLQKRLTILV
jgi:hypothetical protein